MGYVDLMAAYALYMSYRTQGKFGFEESVVSLARLWFKVWNDISDICMVLAKSN